jgi:hypothetical protein
MVPLALRKLANLAGVQCLQHSDPGVHQEIPAFCGLNQAMDSRLPFGPVLFGLWQLRNVVGSVL